MNLKIIGQSKVHSSQSSRDNAPIPEVEAAYRTLTCRARTGAVVLVRVVRSEKAAVIAETLAASLSQKQRAQVLHVASDNPSAESFRALKEVLPTLRSTALDAMRIVMVYEQNMNNKKTQGSRWLSVIMDKFRKRDPTGSAASWGPFYTGENLPRGSADVRTMRLRLEAPDMSYAQAYRSWTRIRKAEVEFLEAVLAHMSIFSEELRKSLTAERHYIVS